MRKHARNYTFGIPQCSALKTLNFFTTPAEGWFAEPLSGGLQTSITSVSGDLMTSSGLPGNLYAHAEHKFMKAYIHMNK